MRLSCWIAIEVVEVKSMEVTVETWRKRGCGIVLMEDRNGFQDGGDEDEAKPGEQNVGMGVGRDGDLVCGVVAVPVGCASEADAVEDAVDIVLWRNSMEKVIEANSFAISFGEMKECSVKGRRWVSLEIEQRGGS